MFGRLKVVKDLVLEKLDTGLTKLDTLLGRTAAHAENEAALLEASIYLAQGMQEQGRVLRQQLELLDQLQGRDAQVRLLHTAVFDRPHLGLLAHLYSWLPEPQLLVSLPVDPETVSHLKKAGYDVFLSHTGETKMRESALHGEMIANAPPAVWLTEDPLHNPKLLGSAVVCPFTALSLTSQSEQMRKQGYHWYVVLYRTPTSAEPSFYCNFPTALPEAFGEVVYFRKFDLFVEARNWCSVTLPPTRLR